MPKRAGMTWSHPLTWIAMLAVVLGAARVARALSMRGMRPESERPGTIAPAIAAAFVDGRIRVDSTSFAATAYDLILRGRFRTVPGQTGDVVDIGVLPGDPSIRVATWEQPVEELLLAACADGPATLGQLDDALRGRTGDSAIAHRAFGQRFEREMTTSGLLDHGLTQGVAGLLVFLPVLVAATTSWKFDPWVAAGGVVIGIVGMFAPRALPVPMSWSPGRSDEARAWAAHAAWLRQLRLQDAQPAALPIEGRALADAVALGIAPGAARAMASAVARTAATGATPGERAHVSGRVAHRAAADVRGYLTPCDLELGNPPGASVHEVAFGAAAAGFLALAVLATTTGNAQVWGYVACIVLALTAPGWISVTRPLRRRVRRRGLARSFAAHVGPTRFVRRRRSIELWRGEQLQATAHGALVLDVRGRRRTSLFMLQPFHDWTELVVTFVDGSRWIGSVAGHVTGDTSAIDGEGTVWFDVGLPSHEHADAA